MVTATTEFERLPIAQRAGTHLRSREPVYTTIRGTKKQVGTWDEISGVFQIGGEIDEFLLRSKMWLTFPWDAWEFVLARAKNRLDAQIEIINHQANECYRTSFGVAIANARKYDKGIGDRFGLPVGFWACYTASWQLRVKVWGKDAA